MKRILLATTIAAAGGFLWSMYGIAHGADLPIKAPVPVAVATYNPFYLGIEGGMGFTAEENVIATPGLATGTPKAFPTSPSVGVAAGWINNTSALAYGLEVYGDFNFSQQDLNCVAGICGARMRNSWTVGADALFGITLGQIVNATPSNAQPQNWKIPVVVPASVMNNLQLLGSVGAVGRSAGLCALDLGTGAQLCGSEWLGGLAVGGQLRFLAASQWDVALKYHHNFYNHTFTPTQSIPLFTNSVSAKGEDTIKFGFNYHL